MDTVSLVFLVILLIAAALGVAGGVIIVGGQRWRRRAAQEAYARGEDTLLAEGEATLEGYRSGRTGASRSRPRRGVLVLTRRHLSYREYFPSREIVVPLRRVQSTETTRTYLEKVRDRAILVVRFAEVDGSVSEAGFGLPDPGGWAREIQQQIGR